MLDDGPSLLVSLSYSGQLAQLRESLTSFTQSVPDQLGGVLPRLPSLARTISDLRDDLNTTFIQFRALAVILTFGAFVIALLVGKVAGDPIAAGDDRDRKRKLIGGAPLGDDFVFLSTLEPARAERWDRGLPITGDDEAALCSNDAVERSGLSRGVWLELLLCLALDVAGCASYFLDVGELSDVGFAFVYAFTLELLFGWPELALFGFWEELLPLTDVVPTATIGWTLVVLGFANDPAPGANVRPPPPPVRVCDPTGRGRPPSHPTHPPTHLPPDRPTDPPTSSPARRHVRERRTRSDKCGGLRRRTSARSRRPSRTSAQAIASGCEHEHGSEGARGESRLFDVVFCLRRMLPQLDVI